MKRAFLYVILFYMLLSPRAEGIQLKLGDKDIKEALHFGSIKKDLSHPELLKAWRIDLGYGEGSATLVTPYAGLVILAKESALKFREPTEREVQKELEEKAGKLSFGCGLYGEEIDFAPSCKAILEYKDEKRAPTYTSLPAVASYTKTYPTSPKFWALCFFHFPMEGIGANDKVTLVLTNAKGKELRFTFDLSQLR
ncbi:MAG: hypothetical protein ACK4WF_00365 [Candidatus Brocadiales bacterium]